MDAIEAALDGIRGALDTDGFDLRLVAIESDGRVRVALEARPDACHDCLLPDNVLFEILEASIKEKDPEVGEVVLEKYGFEDPAADAGLQSTQPRTE